MMWLVPVEYRITLGNVHKLNPIPGVGRQVHNIADIVGRLKLAKRSDIVYGFSPLSKRL